MKKLLSALFAATLTAGVASAQNDDSFRFFFDTAGGTEQGARSAANLAFTNPTVSSGSRLYLYLQYGNASLDFSGVDLTVTVDGPGALTEGNLYNHVASTGLARWMVMPNKTFGPAANLAFHEFGSSFKVAAGGYGAKNTGNVDAEDNHFDRTDGGNGFGTTLLGYVDVTSTGLAEVKIQNGSGGNAGTSGGADGLINASDNVYFGFGDAAVKNKKGGRNGGPGGPTPIADAYVTPEPITLVLLGLGALALRKRR